MKPIALNLPRCVEMSQQQRFLMIPGVEEIGQLFDEADKKGGKGK